MMQQELTKAKDPDLIASVEAMKRAAQAARRIAVQTGTSIVIVEDKQIVHISAKELQEGQGT